MSSKTTIPLFTYRNTVSLAKMDEINNSITLEIAQEHKQKSSSPTDPTETKKPTKSKKKDKKNSPPPKTKSKKVKLQEEGSKSKYNLRKRKKKKSDEEGDSEVEIINTRENGKKKKQNYEFTTITYSESDDDLAFLDQLPVKTSDFKEEDSSSDKDVKSNPKLKETLEALRNLREQSSKKKKSYPDEPDIVIAKDPSVVSLLFKNANTSYKLSVKREESFEVVKQIISKLSDIPETLLQLKYDGIPIILSDNPKSHGMEDDDVVYFERIQVTNTKPTTITPLPSKTISLEDEPNQGDVDTIEKEIEKEIEQKLESALQTKLKADEEAKNNSIKLSVRNQTNQFKFKIQKTDPFSKIIAAVAAKQGISVDKIKLKFEGDTLSPDDTPNDLDMENGDLIDLHIK